MQIVSRKDAVSIGAKRYFTGTPCAYGHVAERTVVNRRCVICNRAGAKAFAAANPERVRATKNRYDARRRDDIRTWAFHMAGSIRGRSKKKSIPANITAADILAAIPSDRICPALGIPLIWGKSLSRNSPSIDRIIPHLGYVVGNIAVISHKANSIKQDALSSSELRRVADWMDSALNILAIAARSAAGPVVESRVAA
jgi:hypothetical protein